MKIAKIAAILTSVMLIAVGCDSLQRDTEFGYAIETPEGYETASPADGFKMAFRPKSDPDALLLSVKAEKIDESIKQQAKTSEDDSYEEAAVKLLQGQMADYCDGGNLLQYKGLTGYTGCFVSAAPEDGNTPRTDVYYIVVNDNVYIFTAKYKNNDAAAEYQNAVLNVIGSIQIM